MPVSDVNGYSLRKMTLSGLIWTFIETFFVRGFSLIATIIFARLLSPADFGTLGMISIFIAVGTSLIDSGLTSSLIRTPATTNEDYSTIFFLNLAISILVYTILFFLAPFIAAFYNQPVLVNIIRIYCLSFIISSFSSIQLTILTKEMRFRTLTLSNLPGTILGVAVGIILAYCKAGLWSIVGMYLTIQFIQTVLLWLVSKWKPSLLFSKEKMKFHYNFGYKLMLSGLLDTFFRNIYNVIIGKFFSIQTLGYYDRANTFNDYPVTLITSIITKVSYPLFSKIQNNKELIANFYRKILQITFFVTAPLMLGAAAVAHPLILFMLGEKWLPAVPYFKIICLASMIYPIHAFNISILKVYGRSDLFLKLEVIKKAVTTISIIAAFPFGIMGIVWSAVFSSIIALIVNTYYSSEMINYTTKQQLRDMFPVLVFSGVMYIIVTFTIKLLSQQISILQITAATAVGLLSYIFLHYLLKSKSLFFTLKLIKERRL